MSNGNNEAALNKRGMTKNDAAEALHVSTKTIDRLIKAGELSATRIGQRILVSTRDVESKLPK